jgi:N-acetylglucosaminyl-diphospho-decaprenol L-rhamnosyltransferase
VTAPVAVAVVSWNTRDLLSACLRSLEPDVRAGRADVWVVDNGSTDGSPELVEESFEWAHLERPGRNLGFGPAVNAVAERTDSPWLVAANADVELEPGALAALLAAAEDEPRAGAIAPQLVLPDGSVQHSVHPFPTLPFTVAFNLGLHRLSPRAADRLCLEGFWDPARARSVPWAVGALLLLRREAFDAVGGFDPRRWMYAEDLDLGWRLRSAGWLTLYTPAARARHAQGAAARQRFGDDQAPPWMAATYRWLAATRGPAVARTIGAVNVAGAAARWALFGALARAGVRRFAGPARTARRWLGAHWRGLRGGF